MNRIIYRVIICLVTAFFTINAKATNPYPSYRERKLSPGGKIYYIDPQKGNDANTGTTYSKPWKTFDRINHLILSAGDKVWIKPGSFYKSLMIIAKASSKKPVSINFEEGRYNIYPDSSYKTALHISNTNDVPMAPKAIALYIVNSKFVNVSANKARIILRGKMIETCISNSSNISLEGLSYDYYRPTVSEMQIMALTERYADLKMNGSSAYSIKDSVLWWEGEGWRHKPEWYWQVFDPKTEYVERQDMNLEKVRYADMGNGIVRAFFDKNPGFKAGLIYQTRDVLRDCAGIFMQYSSNIRLKNVRIYFMHGMGIVSQFCRNIKMDSVIVRPEEGTGRTCSAWADILHFSGCSGRIEISNSYLSAANDDAINVHGTHLRIVERPAENKIKVRFMHNQTYGFTAFLPGDSIDFVHAETLNPYSANIVVNSERLNDKDILLTLKKTVPEDIQANDVVENTTRTPELWVHHTIIARIPTRAILATTRRRILIEHNRFFRVRGNAVLIEDDAESWFESGSVKNATIRHNEFIECGAPVISIHPENKKFNKPVHHNIVISNNHFVLNKNSKVLFAKSTSGIKFSGNEIKSSGIVDIKGVTEFQDCFNIKLFGNVFLPK
ncbi:right-handed parallel beta-helix repeat-containing protein [Mucilaginibacter sp.]|jgi:hypothetical protein|uniref:right-handed parallel beta-helix repeat-containing protein n=1 Tax=Mucilaginibacter sp. TaxID=1882438 RepID=UPI00356AA537